MRKPVFRGLRTTQAQTSLHSLISTFVIPFLESVIYKLAAGEISIFLASLSSWRDWFNTLFVGHPKDRFSRDKAQLLFYHEGSCSVVEYSTWDQGTAESSLIPCQDCHVFEKDILYPHSGSLHSTAWVNPKNAPRSGLICCWFELNKPSQAISIHTLLYTMSMGKAIAVQIYEVNGFQVADLHVDKEINPLKWYLQMFTDFDCPLNC